MTPSPQADQSSTHEILDHDMYSNEALSPQEGSSGASKTEEKVYEELMVSATPIFGSVSSHVGSMVYQAFSRFADSLGLGHPTDIHEASEACAYVASQDRSMKEGALIQVVSYLIRADLGYQS